MTWLPNAEMERAAEALFVQGGRYTAIGLADEMHIGLTTGRMLVTYFKQRKLIYVADYLRIKANLACVYAWGHRKDAPRPGRAPRKPRSFPLGDIPDLPGLGLHALPTVHPIMRWGLR